MKKAIVILAVLLFTSAWATQAQSAGKPQFVFKGSLDLTSMHESVKSVFVSCSLYDSPDTNKKGIGGGMSKHFKNKDGTLKGPFVISCNVDSGKNPSDVTHYVCDLAFVTDKGNLSVGFHGSNPSQIAFKSKKGTERTWKYTGTFNPITKKKNK